MLRLGRSRECRRLFHSNTDTEPFSHPNHIDINVSYIPDDNDNPVVKLDHNANDDDNNIVLNYDADNDNHVVELDHYANDNNNFVFINHDADNDDNHFKFDDDADDANHHNDHKHDDDAVLVTRSDSSIPELGVKPQPVFMYGGRLASV